MTHPPRRRVVITGLGPITPIGIGKNAYWDGLRAGRSGIRTITRFDPAPFPTRFAGEVEGFDPLQYMRADTADAVDRTSHFGIAAARMALDDARLTIDGALAMRTGVMFGTTLGFTDYDYILRKQHVWTAGGDDGVPADPLTALMGYPEAAATEISRHVGARGPSLTFAETCSSALDGIGQAYRAIRSGQLDVVLAGGAQAPISAPIVSLFCMLRGMSTRNDSPETASRPFDKDRDGFVMGEGAGIVVVEEYERARERGAHVYAEILGYAATCDGYHMTNPKPDGRDAARAVKLALADARVAPEEIDYVNAHGTSTPLNDKTETLIVKDVFGAHASRVPISAFKSMIGHLIGAAGSAELIGALLALQHQIIPPTINQFTFDPECDLDYVPNAARPAPLRTIAKNSFGFGGKNSCVIARALDDAS